MRRQGLASEVVVVAMLLLVSASQCQGQFWEVLLPELLKKISSVLYETTEFELLDHYCTFRMTSTFKSFELYFKGRVYCPGWTDVTGKATTRSRSGVVGKTIRDFLAKAAAKGVVTEEQVQQYLGTQSTGADSTAA